MGQRGYYCDLCQIVSNWLCFSLRGIEFLDLHFEFIFLYGVRKYSNFYILHVRKYSNFSILHVAVQFSQHHLLKRLSLPIVYSCLLCQNKVPIGAWVYFLAFYLVALVYISVFVPVPYSILDCSSVV